jgi:hypothetical protein
MPRARVGVDVHACGLTIGVTTWHYLQELFKTMLLVKLSVIGRRLGFDDEKARGRSAGKQWQVKAMN